MSPFRNRAEAARRLRARVERTAAAARRRVDPARWGALARVARFGALRAGRWAAFRRVWERRLLRGRARLVHRLWRRWLPPLEAADLVELEEHEAAPGREEVAALGPRVVFARLHRWTPPREGAAPPGAGRRAVSLVLGRLALAGVPPPLRLRAASAALAPRRASSAPTAGGLARRREGTLLRPGRLLQRPAGARASAVSAPEEISAGAGRPLPPEGRRPLPLHPGVFLRAAVRRARAGDAPIRAASRLELYAVPLAAEPASAPLPPRPAPRAPHRKVLPAAPGAPGAAVSAVPMPAGTVLAPGRPPLPATRARLPFRPGVHLRVAAWRALAGRVKARPAAAPPPPGAPAAAGPPPEPPRIVLASPARVPGAAPAEPGAPEPAPPLELPPVVIEPSVGSPLAPALRLALERRLGIDLSGVRLHTGATAGRATRSLRAAAFTLGRHLFFAPGRFAPWTPSGLALLEHELAHVVQQPAGRPFTAAELPPARQASLEAAAEAARPALARVAPASPPSSRPRLVLAPLSLAHVPIAAPAVPLLAPEDTPAIEPAAAGASGAPGAPPSTNGRGPAGEPRAAAAESVDDLYRLILRRERFEQERRGVQRWLS